MKIGHFRRLTVICWMSQNSRESLFLLSKRIFNISEGIKCADFYWHFNRAGHFCSACFGTSNCQVKKTGSENSYQYLCRALRFAGRKSIRIFYGCTLASESTQHRSFSRRRYSRRYHYAAVKFNLYLRKTEHPTALTLGVLFFFQKIFSQACINKIKPVHSVSNISNRKRFYS